MINLTPTQSQHVYELSDGETGYKYTVYVTKDTEYGAWSATVNISNWGNKTPDGAVEALTPALQHLVSAIQRKVNVTEPCYMCKDTGFFEDDTSGFVVNRSCYNSKCPKSPEYQR